MQYTIIQIVWRSQYLTFRWSRMPTWWLTDAAMFNPVCAHHVRAGRSLEAAAAGSFVASEVEEGARSPCRHRVRCGTV